jgi:hypothetical protein
LRSGGVELDFYNENLVIEIVPGGLDDDCQFWMSTERTDRLRERLTKQKEHDLLDE